MTRTIISALLAISFVSAIVAPAFAHQPKAPAPSGERTWPPKDFWSEQQGRGR